MNKNEFNDNGVFQDFYKILEILPTSSETDIRKAKRVQAKKYHPDTNKDENSTKRMQQINRAFKVLSKKESRIEYDIAFNIYIKSDNSRKQEPKNYQNNPNQAPPKSDFNEENNYEYPKAKENAFKEPDDYIIGTWWTSNREEKVKIFKNKDGLYYGETVWMKNPNKFNNFKNYVGFILLRGFYLKIPGLLYLSMIRNRYKFFWEGMYAYPKTSINQTFDDPSFLSEMNTYPKSSVDRAVLYFEGNQNYELTVEMGRPPTEGGVKEVWKRVEN